jgi:hypothetical protein
MGRIMIVAFLCGLGACSLAAQSRKDDASAQKTIVEQFLQMETAGGRESLTGWESARKYFVHSSPFVLNKTAYVIGKDFTVWNPMITPSGTASVTVDIDPIGQISADLRFKPPAHIYYKNFVDFKLVFTSKRWERDANGLTREIAEPSSRWMIDHSDDHLISNVVAAIRYVNHQRDHATDPSIKRNADQTLLKLRSLH